MPFIIGVDSFFIYYLFMVFIYIVVSQGWNLIGGYTGQVSLSTHAFFALGGYTTALIWIHNVTHTWYYFDPLVMFLSGVVPAIFAILVGLPTLSRLRGDYFSFGTLAAAYILQIIILRTTEFSGGAVGLRLPGGAFTDLGRYYWTALLLVVLAVWAVYAITKSRIGLALRAISEDEVSAASHGIHILKYKLVCFHDKLVYDRGLRQPVCLLPVYGQPRDPHEPRSLDVLPYSHLCPGGQWDDHGPYYRRFCRSDPFHLRGEPCRAGASDAFGHTHSVW